MTSRAARIGKIMPKNTKIRVFIILKNTGVLILLWDFIGISFLTLFINNILKIALINVDIVCNKCIYCLVSSSVPLFIYLLMYRYIFYASLQYHIT